MLQPPWHAEINFQAKLTNSDGARNHLAMIKASADKYGRITVRTEQDGTPPTTVRGYGDLPTIRLADGAVLIVLPQAEDH